MERVQALMESHGNPIRRRTEKFYPVNYRIPEFYEGVEDGGFAYNANECEHGGDLISDLENYKILVEDYYYGPDRIAKFEAMFTSAFYGISIADATLMRNDANIVDLMDRLAIYQRIKEWYDSRLSDEQKLSKIEFMKEARRLQGLALHYHKTSDSPGIKATSLAAKDLVERNPKFPRRWKEVVE